MVDVQELGKLLELPNLEPETIVLINAKMRDLIGDIKPVTPQQKEEMQTILAEWFGGKAGE